MTQHIQLSEGNVLTALALMWTLSSAGVSAAPPSAETPPPPELLAAQVADYFRIEDRTTRLEFARVIEKVAGGDLAAVARAIRSAQLWMRTSAPPADFGA